MASLPKTTDQATTKTLDVYLGPHQIIIEGMPEAAHKRFIKALCTFCEDGVVCDENKHNGYIGIKYTA